MWSCIWANAYTCVIMFTHLSLLLIYRCLTLCLSEHHAKINVWGQASQICELSVSVVCMLTCVCVCVFSCTIACAFLDVCVRVCKPRPSLSPGPNLGLYRGDIRFLSPPHMCVSATLAVIETSGDCVRLPAPWERGGYMCVCVCDDRWHKVLSVNDSV